jgi:hypothetical protein
MMSFFHPDLRFALFFVFLPRYLDESSGSFFPYSGWPIERLDEGKVL